MELSVGGIRFSIGRLLKEGFPDFWFFEIGDFLDFGG